MWKEFWLPLIGILTMVSLVTAGFMYIEAKHEEKLSTQCEAAGGHLLRKQQSHFCLTIDGRIKW